MLTIDGAQGEGGGQILRTALGLGVALGRAVRVVHVRARRPRPGLRPQHLCAVRALAAVSGGDLEGDRPGSTEVTLVPRGIAGGTWRFDVDAEQASAGAVTLVLHALLLPLLRAPGPSRLTLVGGTHVPWSPPVHHVTEVFLPALAQLGVRAGLMLRRWGWYPAGGGEIEATIEPVRSWAGLRAVEEPELEPMAGLSAVSRLPRSIAERQRTQALARLAAVGMAADMAIHEDDTARGPGTFAWLARCGRAGFSALGRRGLPAERVADAAVDALLAWRASRAALDEHLADQLVPVLALAREPSTFTCPRVSDHLRSVASVVEQLAPVRVRLEDGPPARVDVVPTPG